MIHTKTSENLSFFISILLLSLLYVSPAFAGANTPMGNVLCTVVGWMSGNLGKGLETIMITTLGIGALLGKISWGTAMLEGIGGALIFGAAQLVEAMGAGASIGCETT